MGIPMDIFFADPSEVPLPPNEVRIQTLKAEPWPDGQRVRVSLTVDPFQKRPSAEIEIKNSDGRTVAAVTVIESMDRKMEFNLHLREKESSGAYRLSAILYYGESEETEGDEVPTQKITEVARREISFEIP
jgi:hypothetical protein